MILETLVVRLSAELGSFDKQMGRAERRVVRFGNRLQSVGQRLSLGITLPVLAIGTAAVRTAADFESLTIGLEAVTGSASEAAAQLARLREIAKRPAVDLEQAAQSSIAFQAIGKSAQFAERTIIGVANAVALSGGSGQEFAGVMRQLRQVASLGRLMGEEMNVILENAPAMATALQKAFGTTSTEAIRELNLTTDEFFERLMQGMEELPQVAGGAANSMQNLGQALREAGNAIGSVLLPVVMPLVDAIARWAEGLRNVSPETIRWGIALAGVAAIGGPLLLVLGHMTTAVVLLATSLKVALLPLLGVGGAIVIGLGALAAAWIENRLEAAAFRKEMESNVDVLTSGLKKMTLAEAEFRRTRLGMRRESAVIVLQSLQEQADAEKQAAGGRGQFGAPSKRWQELNEKIAEQRQVVDTLNQAWERAQQQVEEFRLAAESSTADTTKALGFQIRAVDQTAESVRALIERRKELEEGIRETQFEQAFVNSKDAADDLNEKLRDMQRELRIVNQELARMPEPLLRLIRSEGLIEAFSKLPEPSTIAPSTPGDMTPRERAAAFMPTFGFTPGMLPPLPEPPPQEGGLLDKIGLGGEGLGQFKAIFGGLAKAALPLTVAFNLIKGAMVPLEPVFKALQEPIQIVGAMLGGVLAPILELLAPPLKLIATIATYVVQGLGWLVEALAKVVNFLIPFGDPLKGLERFGQRMQDEAVRARAALNDSAKAAEYLGKSLDTLNEAVSASMTNVPLIFSTALARTRIATGQMPSTAAIGTSSGDVNIANVYVQASAGDDPMEVWNRVKEGAKRAARGGDPTAMDLGFAT